MNDINERDREYLEQYLNWELANTNDKDYRDDDDDETIWL